MPTTVVNIHTHEGSSFSIMRGYRRKWGNPFRLTKKGQRARIECVLAHARHLEGSGLLDDVHELRGKTLGCVCKPAACHGDALARCADADDPRAELARVIEEYEADLAEILRAENAQQSLWGGAP